MPERDSRPRKKAGLHGWRAFLVVVGSGLAVGVLVIVLIVGVLRLFFSTVQEGIQQQPAAGGPAATREPVTTMSPGAIKLCELIGDAPPIALTSRLDEPDGPDEVGVNGSGRAWTVSDECSWEFIGENSHEWEMRFSYKAVIEAGKRDQRFSMAQDEFGQQYASAQEMFASIDADQQSSDKNGRQRELFGTLQGGAQAYVLVRQVKSSVYVVEIREKSETAEEDYRMHQLAAPASAVSRLVDNPLSDVVPD